MRRASAAAVRPFVDAARGNRRDGAASAVAPKPKRDLRRRAARSVTAEDATDENRRAGIVAAELWVFPVYCTKKHSIVSDDATLLWVGRHLLFCLRPFSLTTVARFLASPYRA